MMRGLSRTSSLLVEVSQMLGLLQPKYKDEYALFACGWNGLKHRLRAATEFSASFAASVLRSSAPPGEQRYEQERDLFGFFTNLLSAFECFFFAINGAAAIVDPNKFPIRPANQLRAATPQNVTDRFKQRFANATLTTLMDRCVAADQYRRLSDVRNFLSHRAAPPRFIYLSTSSDRPATMPLNPTDEPNNWLMDWRLDDKMTGAFMSWADKMLLDLVEAAKGFVKAELPGSIR